MKIELTLDKILIKKINFDKINQMSVILLDETKNNINTLIYEVVDVGPGGMIGNKNIVMNSKPGDLVVVTEYVGSEIEIDGQEYRIINQDNILATIEL